MAKFTRQHYNAIKDVIVKSIKDHKNDCNLKNGIPTNDNDLYVIVGMYSIHEKLGKLFEKDNPKFKQGIWKLGKINNL